MEMQGNLIEGHRKNNYLKKIINKKILNNWLVANSVHNLDLFQYFFGKIQTIKVNTNNIEILKIFQLQ